MRYLLVDDFERVVGQIDAARGSAGLKVEYGHHSPDGKMVVGIATITRKSSVRGVDSTDLSLYE